MKKLQMRQMEGLQGGGYDGACGFMAAIAFVAIFSTGPLAPATGGLIGVGFTAACGGSLLSHLHM